MQSRSLQEEKTYSYSACKNGNQSHEIYFTTYFCISFGIGTSNALANQFQLPVVFYALCLMLASINAVSTLALVLCWAYVVMRWVHAYVHVTSNYVPTRMRVFIGSSVVLLVLFGLSVWELAQI